MKIVIKDVIKNSIAFNLGIIKNDILIKINDSKIKDILDYKFLIADEYIYLEIMKENGSLESYEIEKDYEQDLGIVFENEMIDEPKKCANNCIFCFMDQLPENCRETLLFKDDDYRLSFFTGNYVTLTNMSEKELDRIIKYRLSPINISVHATDSETRKRMLNNKNADKILKYIEKLVEAEIYINVQIVLCKNINDGKILEKTINDLIKFNKYLLSISIVPVGLTKYRENLYNLESYDENDYLRVINQIAPIQKEFKQKYNTNLVFLSDEFYLGAKQNIPEYSHYEDFPQIENGVGLTAEFLDSFETEYKKLKQIKIKNTKISLACGKLIYETIKKCSEKLEQKIQGLTINVILINNYFFGDKITVTGLITGSDLIENINRDEIGDKLFISDITLKDDEDVFLDDLELQYVEQKLNTKIVCVPNFGNEFVKKIGGQYYG